MNLCFFRRFHCDPCSTEAGGDAAFDAHGCTVIVGTASNGNRCASGRDLSQTSVARLQPDSSETAHRIFTNGNEPARSPCTP